MLAVVAASSGTSAEDGRAMAAAFAEVSREVSGRTSRLVVDLADGERFGLRFDARLLQLARLVR